PPTSPTTSTSTTTPTITTTPSSSAPTSTTSTSAPADRTPPSVPTGVTAAAATCSQINLAWRASTDTGGSGLKGYNVYRDGVYSKQVPATATSAPDSGLAASTVYSYAVMAVDNAGNASGMSVTVSTNTPACPDTTPPSTP